MAGEQFLQVIGIAAACAGAALVIWRSTNPDPASGRLTLTADEEDRADARLAWVAATIGKVAGQELAALLKAPRFANRGIYYSPLQNRIRVSRAICARLDDADLALILAHEVGHAIRRRHVWCAWTRAARLREETFADAFALRATSAASVQWLRAVRNSARAEPAGADFMLSDRAKALGVSLGSTLSRNTDTA